MKIDQFFKDEHGKWAVVQWPNILLWAWIGIVAVSLFWHDSHLKILQSCVLFAWAYLEITEGDSYFRRILGAVVMATVLFGIFK